MMRLSKRARMSAVLGAIALVGMTGCGSDTADAGSGGAVAVAGARRRSRSKNRPTEHQSMFRSH